MIQAQLILALIISIGASAGWVYIQHLRHKVEEKEVAIESLATANRDAAAELNTQIELAVRANHARNEAEKKAAALLIKAKEATKDDPCAGKPVPGVIADSLRQQSGH